MAAIVVVVAMLGIQGFVLMRDGSRSGPGTMTTRDGVVHHCDSLVVKSDGSINCTEGDLTIVGRGVTYSFDES